MLTVSTDLDLDLLRATKWWQETIESGAALGEANVDADIKVPQAQADVINDVALTSDA